MSHEETREFKLLMRIQYVYGSVYIKLVNRNRRYFCNSNINVNNALKWLALINKLIKIVGRLGLLLLRANKAIQCARRLTLNNQKNTDLEI